MTGATAASGWTGRFPVGIEEGRSGGVLVHALAVPGCVAGAGEVERAIDRFAVDLSWWLRRMAAEGIAEAPPEDHELEVVVDEWIRTGARVEAGETEVCFDADRTPPAEAELSAWLRLLGALRAESLAMLRAEADPWDRPAGDTTLGFAAGAHARRQWWLLTRLGASPMAEIPEHPFGQLDTAMALAFQQLGHLPEERRGLTLVLDGEEWTPRKAARRMLAAERDFLDLVRATLDESA